jgi:hypothetical protein
MLKPLSQNAIWAVALVCAALILATGGAVAQREMVPIDEPDPAPSEGTATAVQVENFPAMQTVEVRNFPLTVTVEGTVDVGNFPQTQAVAGTVQVGNLPLDADGNVMVAGALHLSAPNVHFVGYTQTSFDNVPATTLVNIGNACNQEFPGSRVCDILEFQESIPAVPPLPSNAVFVTQLAGFTGPPHRSTAVLDSEGNFFQCTVSFCSGSAGAPQFPIPAACCGF